MATRKRRLTFICTDCGCEVKPLTKAQRAKGAAVCITCGCASPEHAAGRKEAVRRVGRRAAG